MFWRRFKRNGLAVASLIVIGLFTLVAILGYAITPDHTPHCNQQYLELASLKPMSRATFVYISDPSDSASRSVSSRLLAPFTGTPLSSTAIPVYS